MDEYLDGKITILGFCKENNVSIEKVYLQIIKKNLKAYLIFSVEEVNKYVGSEVGWYTEVKRRLVSLTTDSFEHALEHGEYNLIRVSEEVLNFEGFNSGGKPFTYNYSELFPITAKRIYIDENVAKGLFKALKTGKRKRHKQDVNMRSPRRIEMPKIQEGKDSYSEFEKFDARVVEAIYEFYESNKDKDFPVDKDTGEIDIAKLGEEVFGLINSSMKVCPFDDSDRDFNLRGLKRRIKKLDSY